MVGPHRTRIALIRVNDGAAALIESIGHLVTGNPTAAIPAARNNKMHQPEQQGCRQHARASTSASYFFPPLPNTASDYLDQQ